MKLIFDERGHIKPYELIEIDWGIFETTFVQSFDKSSSRYDIFNEFLLLLNHIKSIVKEEFEIWINGSFTTLKENPNDIDVLFFISNKLINNDLKNSIYYNQRIRNRKIDAYIIEVFPEEHTDYSFYYSDTKYWLSLFGATSPNRKKERFLKGILKIIIQNNE